MMTDNATLDKVFNLVFGQYAKLHLLPDSTSLSWPKFTIIAEGKIGVWWTDVRELWVGPPELAAEGLLTQLHVNILGEDATKLPISRLALALSRRDQQDQAARELPTTASDADPIALRVKRYIARGVIKLLEEYDGLAIVEDCDVEHTILNVSSLEELLVKADLA